VTTVGGSAKATSVTLTTEISVPEVTTNVIHYSNVHIPRGFNIPDVVVPQASVSPRPFIITPVVPFVTASPMPRVIRPPPWPFGSPAPGPGGASPTTTTTTTTTEFVPPPVWHFPTDAPVPPTTVFPTETASWVEHWVPEPTVIWVNGQPKPVIPCHAWFIWSCPPGFGGIVLHGFEKPGIYPRGGPPGIGPGPLLPGIKLPKIPWPPIKILPDNTPEYPEQPDPDEHMCETATASVCTYTTSFGVVGKRDLASPTITPASRVPFAEFLRLGKRDETTTTTTTISFCTQVTGCGATDITETSSATSTATPTAYVISFPETLLLPEIFAPPFTPRLKFPSKTASSIQRWSCCRGPQTTDCTYLPLTAPSDMTARRARGRPCIASTTELI